MTRIAVLGANGRIARIAEDMLLAHDDIELTLFIHTENELGADIKNNPRVTLVKGDAKNPDDVLAAIKGAEVSRKSVASEVVELLLNPARKSAPRSASTSRSPKATSRNGCSRTPPSTCLSNGLA